MIFENFSFFFTFYIPLGMFSFNFILFSIIWKTLNVLYLVLFLLSTEFQAALKQSH